MSTKILYKFKKGDCLCNIAKKYNTTVVKICEDNGLTNIDFVKENDILIIVKGVK